MYNLLATARSRLNPCDKGGYILITRSTCNIALSRITDSYREAPIPMQKMPQNMVVNLEHLISVISEIAINGINKAKQFNLCVNKLFEGCHVSTADLVLKGRFAAENNNKQREQMNILEELRNIEKMLLLIEEGNNMHLGQLKEIRWKLGEETQGKPQLPAEIQYVPTNTERYEDDSGKSHPLTQTLESDKKPIASGGEQGKKPDSQRTYQRTTLLETPDRARKRCSFTIDHRAAMQDSTPPEKGPVTPIPDRCRQTKDLKHYYFLPRLENQNKPTMLISNTALPPGLILFQRAIHKIEKADLNRFQHCTFRNFELNTGNLFEVKQGDKKKVTVGNKN